MHDAANILRRYFNQLPEPIIPLEFYDRFRDPLRDHQSQAVGPMEGQKPAVGDFDHQKTIRIYQQLITELPPLNRQLLLYILDLLAVFASKSDLNKMTTPNLAAIFQPGILSHPSHDMAPPEYRLSQDVLIFLIENQDHFLIGMPGTGADEKTKQDVESGPPTPSVGRAPKSLLGRSSSGASKYSSGVRRSVSVSSKQSATVVPSPVSPAPHTPTASGVHRSNTVPSKHSPRPGATRFQRESPSEVSSPVATPMYTPAEMPGAFPNVDEAPTEANAPAATVPAPPEVISPSPPETTPAAEPAQPTMPANPPLAELAVQVPPRQPSPRPDAIDIPPSARSVTVPTGQETPTSGNRLAAFFAGKPSTPSAEGAKKPNKLQKKRMPGSSNPSAQSSSHSLTDASNAEQMSVAPSTTSNVPLLAGQSSVQQTPTTAAFLQPPSADNTPLKPPPPIGGNKTEPMSPAHSYRSHSEFTEGELDDDVQPLDPPGLYDVTSDKETDQADTGKRRRFWRKKGDSVSHASHSPSPNVEAQRSRSSVLSGGDGNRRSLTLDRNTTLSDPESDNHRSSKPMGWFKGKLAERAERKEEKDRLKQEAKEEKKRAKSPPPPGEPGHNRGVSQNVQSLDAATAAANLAVGGSAIGQSSDAPNARNPPTAEVPMRGKSMDLRRDGRSMDVPREQVMQPKQSMDAAVRNSFQSPSFAPQAVAPVDESTSADSSVNRQRSLLEVGEEAAARQAAQAAAANAGKQT